MHWLAEKTDRGWKQERNEDINILERERKQSEVNMMYRLDEWKLKWKKILLIWINKRVEKNEDNVDIDIFTFMQGRLGKWRVKTRNGVFSVFLVYFIKRLNHSHENEIITKSYKMFVII